MDTKSTERDRIQQLMESEGLNSVQFATETGIKSATLSHILNGRNNPSLDVMKQILDRYRSVNSDWLILGIGQMYRQKTQSQTLSLFDEPVVNNIKSEINAPILEEKTVSGAEQTSEKKEITEIKDTKIELPPTIIKEISKSVDKIIVYYSDNTFEEFSSQKK